MSLLVAALNYSDDLQCFDRNYFYVNYRGKFIVKTCGINGGVAPATIKKISRLLCDR